MEFERAASLPPNPARRDAIQVYFWRVPIEIPVFLLLIAGVLAVSTAMHAAAAALAFKRNAIANALGARPTPVPTSAVASPVAMPSAASGTPSRSPSVAPPFRPNSGPRRRTANEWKCSSHRSRSPEPPHPCAALPDHETLLARAARARWPHQAWAYMGVFTPLMAPPIAVAIAAVALLFACVRHKNERAASTAQFDLWLADECDWLVARGQEKLGLRAAASILDVDDRTLLDEPQRILCGFSPADIEVPDWSHLRFATLRERHVFKDHWRHSTYRLTVVFPLRHHIALYHCDFDFMNGALLSEAIADCHYKDVVALTVDERLRRRPPLPRWWHRHSRSLRQITYLAASVDTIEDLARDWLPVRDDLRSALRLYLSSGSTLAIDYPRNDVDSLGVSLGAEIGERVAAIREAIREQRLAHAA